MRELDDFDALRVMGVYKIVCVPTGDFYIGGAIQIERRVRLGHMKHLARGTEHCKKLQELWDVHGAENFVVTLVERVEDEIFLHARETAWITRTQPTLNRVMSGFAYVTSRQVRSKAAKKMWKDPQFRARIAAARKRSFTSGWTASPKQLEHLKELGKISAMKKKHKEGWLAEFEKTYGYIPERYRT